MNGEGGLTGKWAYWARRIGATFVVVVSLFVVLSLVSPTEVLAKEKPPEGPQEVEEIEIVVSKDDPSDDEDDDDGSMFALDLAPISNTLVDDRANASVNPSVATDSSGNIYVVYEHAYSASDHDIHCARSTDGGLTWTNYVVDWAYTDSRQPSIFIDADDKLWVAYTVNGGFRFATSTDGTSWTVWGIGSWTWYAQASYPTIGVQGDYAYIAFQYDRNGNGNEYDVSYVYSENGGTSWYNRQNAAATNRHERYPSLGISGSRVGVAYEHGSNQGDHSIRYAYNGGLGDNNWTILTVYSSSEARYPPLVASGDDWIVAFEVASGGGYDVYVRRFIDGGQNWEGSGTLVLNGARSPAITSQGANAWLVGLNGSDVVLTRSTDGGATWDGTPVYVVDTDTAVASLHGADVASWRASDGSTGWHPVVAWVDSRNSGTNYDIYYALLNDDPLAVMLDSPSTAGRLT